MESFVDQLTKFSELGPALTGAQVIFCLLLSFTLGLVVAKVYQISYRGTSYSPAFMQTLVLCTMVVGGVMIIIGSNIARAFSLVGALSIVRFRNAVKDPRDVGFIFFAMAVGMACGTGFYQIAVALTLGVSIGMLTLSLSGFGQQPFTDKILKISMPEVPNFEHIFDPILKAFSGQFSLLSIESHGEEKELTYSLRVKRSFNAEKMIKALSDLHKNVKVRVLGSNFTIDL